MSNNFTQKAENALNRAVKIAEECGHTYIGTEHILLSLAEDETCCAAILLKKNKVSKEKIAEAITYAKYLKDRYTVLWISDTLT